MAYSDPADPRAREARRRHYEKNKPAYIERAKKQRRELLALLDKLRDRPCSDCEGVFPVVCMDFHHREPAEKEGLVRNFAERGNRKAMLAEVAKCDVVCANCHRIRHAGCSPSG